jgi:predicted MPP superfamily phosphohydrolase
MKVFFILLLSGLYLGGNYYIFVRGMQAIRYSPPIVKAAFGIFILLSALALILMFVIRDSRSSATLWAHLCFVYASGWLVFALYMVLFLFCFDLFRLFVPSFHSGFVCALALTVGLLSYGLYRYRHPSTRIVDITIHKPLTGNDSNSFKIVAVSDIHLGMGTAPGQLEKYVRMINGQKPDLILVAGDLIDNSIVAVRERRMQQTLSQLQSKSGICMVPGNHEYISGIAECAAFISETPVCFLQDTVVTLPNGIQIIGRDDRSNPARKPFSQLAAQVNFARPVIVFDHQPSELTPAVDAGADLLFCGHTHNGQVWPMNWLTSLLFDISYGFEKRRNTNICVSSGLALWGPPFRIGSCSEMVVFNLSFQRP